MASNLQFRQKGLKKEGRTRLLILLAIFIISLIFFEIVLNFTPEESPIEMSNPTLPTVSMSAFGEPINEIHGYVTEMDALYMRDAVIPLSDDRKLPLTINTYGNTISSIKYEIRSTDTQRKIAETDVTDFVELKEGTISATLQIENLVDVGEEFLFILTLNDGTKDIYYYTRILMAGDSKADLCLDFAKDFHNKALLGSQDELATFVETDSEADGKDLSFVNINSTVSQICWGNFDGTIVNDPVIEFKDVNDNYTAIVMYYQMQRKGTSGSEYYNVEEYFKVRYASERMYLLDYERTMNQILTGENISIEANVLTTGINSSDIEYLSNETGTIVAFVQAGSLYEYNQNKGELSSVFSFIGSDITDLRATYNEHKILLLNIDETGTMDFVVYGYMNSGLHEGECGIDLFHYDSSTGDVHEEAFIKTTSSYQILNASFSQELYKSTGNDFYIMVDGSLIKVNLDSLEMEELLVGLSDHQYAASKSGRFFAWMVEDNMDTSIHILDLETSKERLISANASDYVRPLAFLEDDLIYGTIHSRDISTDAAGSDIYPMSELHIVDVSSDDLTVLKTYEDPGYYVSNVSFSGYTLYLERMTRQEDGTYTLADSDTIKDSTGEANKTVDVASIEDNTKGKVTTFTMSDINEDDSAKHFSYKTAGLIMADLNKVISVKASQAEEKYFVYVGSKVTYAGTDITSAIISADEEMGIVVDNTQQYIWKRGKSAYKSNLTGLTVGPADTQESSAAQCISVMLVREGENVEVHTLLNNGSTPIDILRSALRNATVLDLTGCSLSEVLYYVYIGSPVYTIGENGESLLIIGYDAANITVYNPVNGSTYKKGLNDATAEFEAAGNVFISYIK